MKNRLNYELLEFHVGEASWELKLLLLHIQDMSGKPLSEAERELLYRGKLSESGLQVSLEHAYHHLNFAWNVRHRKTGDADRYFDRDEKFPRAFTRLWPKSLLKKRRKRSCGNGFIQEKNGKE